MVEYHTQPGCSMKASGLVIAFHLSCWPVCTVFLPSPFHINWLNKSVHGITMICFWVGLFVVPTCWWLKLMDRDYNGAGSRCRFSTLWSGFAEEISKEQRWTKWICAGVIFPNPSSPLDVSCRHSLLFPSCTSHINTWNQFCSELRHNIEFHQFGSLV